MYGKTKVCKKCAGPCLGAQEKCKPCRAIWQRAWRAKHPAASAAASSRWAAKHPQARANNSRCHDLRKYGITPEQFDALLTEQDFRCVICGTDAPGGPGGRFVVDHDHSTGAVRGLLCCNCNFLLGHASDNIAILAAAIDYLKKQDG